MAIPEQIEKYIGKMLKRKKPKKTPAVNPPTTGGTESAESLAEQELLRRQRFANKRIRQGVTAKKIQTTKKKGK